MKKLFLTVNTNRHLTFGQLPLLWWDGHPARDGALRGVRLHGFLGDLEVKTGLWMYLFARPYLLFVQFRGRLNTTTLSCLVLSLGPFHCNGLACKMRRCRRILVRRTSDASYDGYFGEGYETSMA